jgi:nitrite reductase (NADH) small subunit
MDNGVRIGDISQIPSGEGRVFDVKGLRLAVFHTRAGEVFATQAHCPHRGGPLADGLVDAATVVCPLHDRAYDLRTGAGLGNDCSIATYPVEVRDGAMILKEDWVGRAAPPKPPVTP